MTAGSCSPPPAAASSNSSSGRLLHRKNETRGRQLEAVQPIGGPRLDPGRIGDHPEQEVGTHQQRPERTLDAGLEPAGHPPFLVEGHQRRQIPPGDGTAVGAAGQPRQNLPGAGRFLDRVRGLADEDAAPGGRVLDARRVERPGDREGAQMRLIQQVVALAVGAFERLAQALGQRVGLLDEGGGHRPRAGGKGNAHPQLVGSGVVGGALIALRVDRRQPEQGHALAVHADLKLVRLAYRGAGEQVEHLELDVVLAVPREVVGHREAAAGAERQTVAVVVLGEIRDDAEGLPGRGHRRRPHRQPADVARRVHVAFEQGGRHLQHAGDVVEPVALIVGRHQRRGVHVEREEVADGVLILGSVQPVQGHGAARVGPRRRGLVDLGLEPGGKAVGRRRIGARAPQGRHGAGADLPDDLFPDLGLRRHVLEVDALELDGDRAARRQAGVVAGHAVPFQQSGMTGNLAPALFARHLRHGRLRRLGRAGRGEPAPGQPDDHRDAGEPR